ncbi:MAG TPA: cytochrome P450 [Allosphingosinicella sp.]|nr:cytochrome P450 [Allosphingosinicella sp.]
MADSEAPRIKLIGPVKAPPVELLRWLFEARAIPFESVPSTAVAPSLIETPAGGIGGLWPALEWLDEISRASEGLFPEDGDRAFVQSLCAELDPQPLPPKPERIAEAFARVEAALGSRDFLDGERPGTRDIAFAVLATPFIQDGASRPAAALALRVWQARPPVRDHGKVPADRPPMLAELRVRLFRWVMRVLASVGPRRFPLGKRLAVFRWQDVDELLRRDADFAIAPVNAERIEGVMGPFILGMDASVRLHAQRESNYAALRDADKSGLVRILATEPARLAGDAARRLGRIDVVNFYARPVAARVAASLFGIAGPTEQDLMRAARAIFQETFLNLDNQEAIRTAGRAAGREMMAWIDAEVVRRGDLHGDDVVGRLLTQVAGGRLRREEVPWIAAGLLVGSVDTTATVVANIVNEAVRDDALLAAMRRDSADPDRLAGWCWEALRRRPHNPAVLRLAGGETRLAGGTIPAGKQVLAMTLAAMQDKRAFPHPAALDPARPRNLYMHFGRGLHRCSGRGINDIQVPALIRALLDHGLAGPADSRSRGPFPDRLVVSLGRGP